MGIVINLDDVPDLTITATYGGENKELVVPEVHSAIQKKVIGEGIETLSAQADVVREICQMPNLSDTAAMKLFMFMDKAATDFMDASKLNF